MTMNLLIVALLLMPSVFAGCPQDPLECLIKWRATSTSSIDQNNRMTNIIPEDHLESADETVHSDQHSDGIFSLNDTQAEGCKENQTLTSDKICKKCSKCPKNGVVLRSCNSTHDTKCSCPNGSYLSVLEYECKPCSSCPYGQVYKRCTRYRDTKCGQCPPGFFYGSYANQMGCLQCSRCHNDQIMLQECTKSQNTVCLGEYSLVLSCVQLVN